MAEQKPLITVAIVPTDTAQLVIPHAGCSSFALAYRIAARACELVESYHGGARGFAMPYVEEGRLSTCVTVRIETVGPASAIAAAEILTDAATSCARDAAGFTTHRIERKS